MLVVNKLWPCTSRTPHLLSASATCRPWPCPGLSPGQTTTATPSPWPSRAVGDPMFRYRRTLQHPVGVLFLSLCDLIGHWPLIWKVREQSFNLPAERASVSNVLPMGDSIHRLDSRIKAIQLSPVVRVLRPITLQRFRMVAALRACYGPLGLSTSGKHVDPGTSFQVPPVYNGDTTVRDMAHTIYCGTGKHS